MPGFLYLWNQFHQHFISLFIVIRTRHFLRIDPPFFNAGPGRLAAKSQIIAAALLVVFKKVLKLLFVAVCGNSQFGIFGFGLHFIITVAFVFSMSVINKRIITSNLKRDKILDIFRKVGAAFDFGMRFFNLPDGEHSG
jgi:hypothetical protein